MARSPLFRQLKQNISRRDFLKSVGVSALTYPLWPHIGHTGSRSTEPVIILGAGLAGLTAAYTLQKARVPFLIFEAQDTVGGRVSTLQNFNEDKQFVELGAELIDTDHRHLMALTKELNVELEQLVDRETEAPSEIFYCDGKIYSKNQFQAAVEPFMRKLRTDYRRVFPNHPLGVTYKTAGFYPEAKKYDQMSLAQYLFTFTEKAESWILKIVQAAYESEFGLPAEEQSALNLFFLMGTQAEGDQELFAESNQSHRIKGGNSRLIEALKTKIEPGFIRTSHRLLDIREQGSALQCTFQFNGQSIECKSRQVICTLPFSTLREVSGVEKLPLSSTKKKCIADLGYGTNSKIMLGFRERFWLPPFATTYQLHGELIGTFASKSFWETSRKQPGSRGILTNYTFGKLEQNPTTAALNDLGQIFPRCESSFENRQVVANWAEKPFARGAYACLKVGQHTTLCGSAGEAELNGRLLFAGEHASIEYQGFMEGAIETALAATRQITYSRRH